MIATLALVAATTLSAYPVDTIRTTGPASNRIDIVILGDGYTAADQTKFTQDATALTNTLFSATPWKEYAGLFNVRAIHVTSNQNGADNGSYGTTRDTALGAYYLCANIDRLICIDSSAVYNIASQATPDYDLLVVLVNDPKYGGSGGAISVASTNSSSAEIMIHELGHTLGGLADEYESAYPGYPACGTDCPEPNATPNATSTVKWKSWIPTGTPIPTPEGNASYTNNIGVFEGARYLTSGVYRPKDTNCRMRVLGAPYCSVCTEAMVKAFWNRVSMFDAKAPAASSSAPLCSALQFNVTQPALFTPTYFYSWTVNGAGQSANSASYSTNVSGNLNVTLKVQDSTALVRNDPTKILEDSTSWTVTATGGSCGGGSVCMSAGTCLADGGCSSTPLAQGTSCGTASCSNGTLTSASSCDGAGTCVSGTQTSCGGYTCASSSSCRTSCSLQSHCKSGFECVMGQCLTIGTNDAGTSNPPDAGVTQPDAGSTQPDAGVSGPDAGVTPQDAGVTEPDAGVTEDAGTVDTIDAGTSIEDPLPTPLDPVVGACGCNASSGLGAFGLLGLAFVRRRRRSRSSNG